MGVNPDTNKFEQLSEELFKKEIEGLKTDMAEKQMFKLLRPDGTEVPNHWAVFKVGEKVVIKNYTFEVKYIGETAILFEPIEPIIK